MLRAARREIALSQRRKALFGSGCLQQNRPFVLERGGNPFSDSTIMGSPGISGSAWRRSCSEPGATRYRGEGTGEGTIDGTDDVLGIAEGIP